MDIKQVLTGDPGRSSVIYLAIGGLSLVKAIAVRKDSTRFKRELLDAGLFIGIGLLLRRYSNIKAEKRAELQANLPEWLLGDDSSSDETSPLVGRAKRRFGTQEPEPEPSLRERAMQVVPSRT